MSEKIKLHRVWRKEAKKQRRKKIRQKFAQLRDEKFAKEEEENLKNPTYLTRLVEQRALELFKQEEDERVSADNHEKWLRAELIAQSEFRKLQRKLEEIENEKNKARIKIKEEFQREQERVAKLKNEKKRIAEEKLKTYDLLMSRINSYINNCGDLPEELTLNADTNPGKPICSFFIKTGACRFGDRCLRNHSRPGISRLLLIPNFFTHIQLDQCKTTEYGGDSFLEYDDNDLQINFNDFFFDVSTEFEIFGKLEQFFVCCNYEPHLRGNVYIQYINQRDALKAYQKIQGRFYGGKQLNVEFCSVISWMTAICGLSFSKQCPKSKSCNFLHIFKNPNYKYPLIERKSIFRSQRDPYIRRNIEDVMPQTDNIRNRSWNDEDVLSKRNWRWSESPEIDRNYTDKQENRLLEKKTFSTEKSFERSPSRSNSKRKSKLTSTRRSRSKEYRRKSPWRSRSKEDKQKSPSHSSKRKSKDKEELRKEKRRKSDKDDNSNKVIVKKHKRKHKKSRK